MDVERVYLDFFTRQQQAPSSKFIVSTDTETESLLSVVSCSHGPVHLFGCLGTVTSSQTGDGAAAAAIGGDNPLCLQSKVCP